MRPPRKLACWVAVAALATTGGGRALAGPAPEAPAPAGAAGTAAGGGRPGRVVRVVAIGDSLTDLRGGGGGYLRELARLCPESRFDSRGRGGEMVNQMRRRFTADVVSGIAGAPHYTHVIVFGGVNDLYSDLTAHRTVERISRDLTAMYQAARAAGAEVVAITVAPWAGFKRHYTALRGTRTEELNRFILGRVAAGEVDAAVDAHSLLGCGAALCAEHVPPFRDGLHFGPTGHRLLAEALRAAAFRDCR